MWFKQINLLNYQYDIENNLASIIEKLQPLAYKPCSANLPSTSGWVSPCDEPDMPLAVLMDNKLLLCLQIEEKILPASVIREELKNKLKEIESQEDRKVRTQEKYALKEALWQKLLPQAFSKFNRLYAYFDLKNHWLVLNTTQNKAIETFVMALEKVFPGMALEKPAIKNLNTMMTHWLQNNTTPEDLAIQQSCHLFDPKKDGRNVRCQQQDLTTMPIQGLFKEGYQVKQLSFAWHDQIEFSLNDEFNLKSIRYSDEVIEEAKQDDASNPAEEFIANFMMMSDIVTELLSYLLSNLSKVGSNQTDEIDDLVTI